MTIANSSEIWNHVLETVCNCYADCDGNRPCDNGACCDLCRCKYVQEIYHTELRKAEGI